MFRPFSAILRVVFNKEGFINGYLYRRCASVELKYIYNMVNEIKQHSTLCITIVCILLCLVIMHLLEYIHWGMLERT
jgi:hypothetical protein